MSKEMSEMLKYIGMRGLLQNWEQYLKMAEKENLSAVKLLKYIVDEEYKLKKENSRKMRIRRATIPEKFIIETYPFERQPNLNRKKVSNLYDSFDYMSKPQNIIWMGPTGSGKTGLATSFLMQALNRGHTGRFITFPELIETLYKSRGDHTDGRMIKLFSTYDCLLIDELGYVETEPVQAGLFFTLMSKRYKKKSTLITTNLGFSEWDTFLKNGPLTAALIDRFTENSHVINMRKCISLRSKAEES